MRWADLFDRAEEIETSARAVRETLATHRETADEQ